MSRFYRLMDNFFVALQSNFPPEESVEKFLKSGIEPAVINQEKGQIFHPADMIESSGGMVEIHFAVVTNGDEKWKKLVFFSKVRAIAARFGEVKAFGFEGIQPGPDYKGRDYLLLAFPSISGGFATVYFLTRPRGGHPTYLLVDAEESLDAGKLNGRIIIVRARVVSRNMCPWHLHF